MGHGLDGTTHSRAHQPRLTKPARCPPLPPPAQLVRDLLQKGKAAGFNVMRTWAHTVNPQFALQARIYCMQHGVPLGMGWGQGGRAC